MALNGVDPVITQADIDFLNTYQSKYPKDELKKFVAILEMFASGNTAATKALIDALSPAENQNYQLFKADFKKVQDIKKRQKQLKQTLAELQAEHDRLSTNIGNLNIQRKEIISQGASQLAADMNSYTSPASSASASATAPIRPVAVPGGRK